MTGSVCLQGGNEFAPGCREMDAELLALADGRVVVTALAGAPGREYATATRHGVEHFRSLGGREVAGAPDVREAPEEALAAVRSARLLVLPGGSPSRLLGVLQDTPVGAAVADLLADGGVVMGSSAGAMVLCPWTVLPDRGQPTVAAGLGLVPGVLVVPHWVSRDRVGEQGDGGRDDWLGAIAHSPARDLLVLGIPEESGLLWRDGALTAVGRSPTRLPGPGTDLAPGTSWSPA